MPRGYGNAHITTPGQSRAESNGNEEILDRTLGLESQHSISLQQEIQSIY